MKVQIPASWVHRYRHDRRIRARITAGGALAAVLFGVLLAILTGCSEGSGPTAPGAPSAALSTPYGVAYVAVEGNAFDPAEANAAVERAYAQARTQIGAAADGISIDGMRIRVRAGYFDNAVGMYHPSDDEVEMATGMERVLRHELQHRFCYKLRRPSDCCLHQDHPGGYDLFCNKL